MKKTWIVFLAFFVIACNLSGQLPAVIDGRPGGDYSDDFGGQVPDESLPADETPFDPEEGLGQVEMDLEPEFFIPVLSSLQLPEDFGATRENPYPTHTHIETVSWDFQVLQVMRGQAAWERILEDDSDPLVPPEGYEYLVVQLMIQNKILDEQAYDFGISDIFVVGDRGIMRTDALWGVPSLDLFYKDIYCAETLIGWMDAILPVDETNLLLGIHLEYQLPFDAEERQVHYIALEEGAAYQPPADAPFPEPNNLGADPALPAALGSTVITDSWEVSILEVIRGEQAMAMVSEANPTNPEPEAGYEYLAARLRMGYWSDDATIASIAIDQFSSLTSAGETIPPVQLRVTSDQRHNWVSATFFPGGMLEAWTVVSVPVNEINPLLVFNAGSAWDAQNVYLALN